MRLAYGRVTLSEMADNAGRIASAIKLPVIADADTGYGNELNAIRTVREYEKRGVAGIHIEDQGFPKKCGHLEDKTIVSIEDYVAKIRAAVNAKVDPDFLIIARTDSRAVLGFEEAIRRANAAIEAGADMAFVEAPQTLEETQAVPKLVKGPCMLNMVWRGKTPDLSIAEAEKLNYKFMILPGVLSRTVVADSGRPSSARPDIADERPIATHDRRPEVTGCLQGRRRRHAVGPDLSEERVGARSDMDEESVALDPVEIEGMA